MIVFERDLTVAWGESDPFGLVYFPRMLAWFNDTEHDLLRAIGFPTEKLIERDRTAFVMGNINFNFVGPAAYGERVRTVIALKKITRSTLHWRCEAFNAETGAKITEGDAVRIFARIRKDGNLKSAEIPEDLLEVLKSDDRLRKEPSVKASVKG